MRPPHTFGVPLDSRVATTQDVALCCRALPVPGERDGLPPETNAPQVVGGLWEAAWVLVPPRFRTAWERKCTA